MVKELLIKLCIKNKLKFKRPFNTVEDLKKMLQTHNINYSIELDEFQKSRRGIL